MEQLISIHQVLLKPLVEMMFTELSTPLGSDKCFPCPLIGKCVRMTNFSSDPLLESESCAFLLWNDRFMCIELHKTLLFFPLLISEMNISISALASRKMEGEGQYKF